MAKVVIAGGPKLGGSPMKIKLPKKRNDIPFTKGDEISIVFSDDIGTPFDFNDKDMEIRIRFSTVGESLAYSVEVLKY